jgi:hypothetical protein
MPSTTNPEEEEIVDVPENDGNGSMLEQVKRPNPWKKKMMMKSASMYNFRRLFIVVCNYVHLNQLGLFLMLHCPNL